MTDVTIYKSAERGIVGFSVAGHVDFNLEGQDVLCAAVSTIVSHTIGAINEFTSDACENIVDEQKPVVIFRLTAETPSPESTVLLNAFASSMEDLSLSHQNYISITYKEV